MSHAYIAKVTTLHVGGNCMLDVVELESGHCIVLNGEVAVLFPNRDAVEEWADTVEGVSALAHLMSGTTAAKGDRMLRTAFKAGGEVVPRVEGRSSTFEAALLEDCDRLRRKIHVMGEALKHQRTALMIVRDRQSGTARVEDINQGIAQIDAALSYIPPEVPHEENKL